MEVALGVAPLLRGAGLVVGTGRDSGLWLIPIAVGGSPTRLKVWYNIGYEIQNL